MIESLDFPDLCEAGDHIQKNVAVNRNQLLLGNALPSSYSELGNLVESPFLNESVPAELNHCLLAIREYKDEISTFLTLKTEYEHLLITGDLHEADRVLTKIESEICYSLWTLENRFLIKECSGKAAANKEMLSEFYEDNPGRSITKHLAHYLSIRAERSLSVNRYFNDLELALTSLNNSSTKESFQNYYRFKLTFLSHIEYTDYAAILAIDFNHSIIDRFLNMTRVMTSLLAVSNYLEDGNPKKILLKQYLKNRLYYLMRKINDPTLYKLKLFSGETLFPAFDIEESRGLIRLIDEYSKGRYSKVEKGFSRLILQNPMQFDLYPLYVKSLIYQGKPFKSVGRPTSLQNEILADIYKVISVNSNTDQSAHNLLRIANNLSSSNLSYGIVDFVFYQTKGKNERKLLARLSYNAANPAIHEVYASEKEQKEYLQMLSEKYPDSLTISFLLDRLEGVKGIEKYEGILPTEKYKIELALKLQEDKDYLKASTHWEYLVSNHKNANPILETAILNLFDCYLELGRPNECINLYVNSYFQNNHIISKIDVSGLLELVRSNRFKNVERTIRLPIFYSITETDEVEAHIAYELFNRANEVERPSDLINRNSEFDEVLFNHFLEFACSPKILMHSTFIGTSKDRLEERLSLVNYLKTVKPDSTTIQAEIKSIENILVIQQGMIDLDESKIYVNETGIIENELQEFEAVYERLDVIAGITGNKTFLYLEGGKLTTYSSKENTEVETVEYSNNPVYDIYLELFNAVKDKFLHSQYGIVAYLSTRIRHGVLVGELRPIFETHNLITLKEGNSSSYRLNFHWIMVYSRLDQGKQDQLQAYLKEFSSRVDGIIFDLIKKHLQVYVRDVNDEGWFNYEFERENLWLHSITSLKSSSFEDFVQQVFAVLWTRTDENLARIRRHIEKDILSDFNNCFDDLERNITALLGLTHGHEIIKAIKDCSTEIHTVTQKISRWFKRSQIQAADFSLSEVVDIVSEYTNKSTWQKHLSLKKNLEFDCSIKGEYKVHFADLIRIFLENILKHSKDDAIEIDCEITSTLKNDTLLLSIQNEITEETSIEELRNIWKGGKLDLVKLVSEKKSGYHKARKILKYDLGCESDECLQTQISEDEEHFTVQLAIDITNVQHEDFVH